MSGLRESGHSWAIVDAPARSRQAAQFFGRNRDRSCAPTSIRCVWQVPARRAKRRVGALTVRRAGKNVGVFSARPSPRARLFVTLVRNGRLPTQIQDLRCSAASRRRPHCRGACPRWTLDPGHPNAFISQLTLEEPSQGSCLLAAVFGLTAALALEKWLIPSAQPVDKGLGQGTFRGPANP
jgi:hypothetical protein